MITTKTQLLLTDTALTDSLVAQCSPSGAHDLTEAELANIVGGESGCCGCGGSGAAAGCGASCGCCSSSACAGTAVAAMCNHGICDNDAPPGGFSNVLA